MRRYAVTLRSGPVRRSIRRGRPGFEFRSENFTNQVKIHHRRRRLAAISIVATFSMLSLVLAGAGAAARPFASSSSTSGFSLYHALVQLEAAGTCKQRKSAS